MQQEMTALALRKKKDAIWPGGFAEDDNLGLRVHRAISWIERAEEEADDADAAFAFYWIGFQLGLCEGHSRYTGNGRKNSVRRVLPEARQS